MNYTDASPGAPSATAIPAPGPLRRRLGEYGGETPGPLVICLGGIHGNERAGVVGIQRVLDELQRGRPPFRGRLVGLAGNLEALQLRRRYVDLDLNRIWLAEDVRALQERAPDLDHAVEHRQQRELLVEIRELVRESDSPVYFLDLHTSSADGPPFICIGDTLRNRTFARPFPAPVFLGLEEQIDGGLLEYLNNGGMVTLGFEAGRHEAPRSVEFQVAAVWLALESAGCLRIDDVAAAGPPVAALRAACAGLPRTLEVRYRHPVSASDRFVMDPGWETLDPVRRGQRLAEQATGPVHAPWGGRMLLPLYQGQGDDGFFLAREFRPFWLRVSALLRHLRLSRLLPRLPGVSSPGSGEPLVVDRQVARWWVVELFHLLGYRKCRDRDGRPAFSRRRFDRRPPDRVEL